MRKSLIFSMLFVASAMFANDGTTLYKKCVACHGVKGEKPALGKSEVIAGWDQEKFITAMKGYKDGSYGKAMKGMMKSQVASLSDADIKALAEYVHGLK